MTTYYNLYEYPNEEVVRRYETEIPERWRKIGRLIMEAYEVLDEMFYKDEFSDVYFSQILSTSILGEQDKFVDFVSLEMPYKHESRIRSAIDTLGVLAVAIANSKIDIGSRTS